MCGLAAVSALALLGACDSDPSPAPVEPFVDMATVKSAFTEVRDCRLSIEHAAVQIQVFAAPGAAEAYTEGTYPFAPGTVIVKVEHDDLNCTELLGYTAMRRLEDGASPEGKDWEWQRLDAAGKVLESGAPSACVSCHTSCTNGRDMTCTNAE